MGARCSGCQGRVIDAGDEFACESCGMVTEKMVLECPRGSKPGAIDFTPQALGGYLGSMSMTRKERLSSGFRGLNSSYSYLKRVSDFAGKVEGREYATGRLMERVCEKLMLPNSVLLEGIAVMKRVLSSEDGERRVPSAALSAFALATACKIEGITSVTIREIVEAHRAHGRRVKVSALIQLSMESPVRPAVRKPEDYIGRVLGRVSNYEGFLEGLKKEGESPTVYLNALRELALEILSLTEEDEKAGHSPCGLAATAIYAAEVQLSQAALRKKRLTQRGLASCGDTAEYTVREQFREIFEPVLSRLRSGASPGSLAQR